MPVMDGLEALPTSGLVAGGQDRGPLRVRRRRRCRSRPLTTGADGYLQKGMAAQADPRRTSRPRGRASRAAGSAAGTARDLTLESRQSPWPSRRRRRSGRDRDELSGPSPCLRVAESAGRRRRARRPALAGLCLGDPAGPALDSITATCSPRPRSSAAPVHLDLQPVTPGDGRHAPSTESALVSVGVDDDRQVLGDPGGSNR